MRNLILFILSTFVIFESFAQDLIQQKVQLSGRIFDDGTNETIIGVKVLCDNSIQAKSDVEGKYSLLVDANKTHELRFTFLGYDTLYITVKVGNSPILRDISLSFTEMELDEVVVKGEAAKSRETPVAFSK